MDSATRLTSESDPEKRRPVLCAACVATLAIIVAGSALWLTSAVIQSNAAAAQMILGTR
jgi:hypothetical protein